MCLYLLCVCVSFENLRAAAASAAGNTAGNICTI